MKLLRKEDEPSINRLPKIACSDKEFVLKKKRAQTHFEKRDPKIIGERYRRNKTECKEEIRFEREE